MDKRWQINKALKTAKLIKKGELGTIDGIVKLYDAAMPLGNVAMEPFTTISGLFSEAMDALSEFNCDVECVHKAQTEEIRIFSKQNESLLESVCDELLAKFEL